MTFRYFKHNFHRQFILYSFTAISALLLYDSIIVNHSIIELIVSISIGGFSILSLLYNYLCTITIDAEGIKHRSIFREYLLMWEDISKIKIIPRWKGKSTWVIILKSDNPKHLHLKRNAYNRYMECITFPLIPKAFREIAKYRGKEDYFESNLFGHRMYKKLGKF